MDKIRIPSVYWENNTCAHSVYWALPSKSLGTRLMLTLPGKSSTGASRSDNHLRFEKVRLLGARKHVSHMHLDTRLPRFSLCSIEKLGGAWGQGYIQTSTCNVRGNLSLNSLQNFSMGDPGVFLLISP